MREYIGCRSRFLYGIIFFFAILTISTSCSKDPMDDMPPAGGNPVVKVPGTNEVWMQGSLFGPETITVTAGTTITWTNKDGVIHSVTSNTGIFDSGNIGNNGTYSFKFANSGTYSYHCTFHPAMTGKVVVN